REQALYVNLRGTSFLSRRAAEAVVGSGGGKIINLSSVHDTVPLSERSAYAISKAGIAMLTKALALELAPHKINVNAIAPGAILTDMNRAHLSNPAARERLLERIPWGRLGEAGDIVGAALFLASSDSDYVTGATIYVDGGLLLRRLCDAAFLGGLNGFHVGVVAEPVRDMRATPGAVGGPRLARVR